MSRSTFLLLVAGCAASMACEQPRADVAPVSSADLSEASGNIVLRVGDVLVRETDVIAAMQTDAVSRDVAIQTLTDEALLYAQAARSGLKQSAEGRRSIERLMVRRFLRDLERDNTPDDITEDELLSDYAKHKDAYDQPERRKSLHVLARGKDKAAEDFANKVLRELKAAKDPKKVWQTYANAPPKDLGFEVRAEDLPAISQKDGFAKPFKDAVFGMRGTGVIPRAIKTKFGWHAIVVTEIQPGKSNRINDVEEEIRNRLSQSKRFDRLSSVIREAESAVPVTRHDEVIAGWAGRPLKTR